MSHLQYKKIMFMPPISCMTASKDLVNTLDGWSETKSALNSVIQVEQAISNKLQDGSNSVIT